MTMPLGKRFRKSRLERQRESWHRQISGRPIEIPEAQKAYRRRHAEYFKALAAARKKAGPWSRLIFRGLMRVLEISCKNCGEAFLIKESKTNAYARFCPVCAHLRTVASRSIYESRKRRRS